MPQVAALLLALPRLARLSARGQQPPPPVPRPAPRPRPSPPAARGPRPERAGPGAGRQGAAGRGGGARGRGRPVRGRGGEVQRQPVTLRVVAQSFCHTSPGFTVILSHRHLVTHVTQSSCHTVIWSHTHLDSQSSCHTLILSQSSCHTVILCQSESSFHHDPSNVSTQ